MLYSRNFLNSAKLKVNKSYFDYKRLQENTKRDDILYCHINPCKARVQYFAILYAHKYCTMSKKPKKTESKYTLTFIR